MTVRQIESCAREARELRHQKQLQTVAPAGSMKLVLIDTVRRFQKVGTEIYL